ncbi:MAG: glycosyl transferase family 2, partial [Bacteroidetes bacterium]|nr:glycosyl transferase family 2 [Bacteroidota bacterium]
SLILFNWKYVLPVFALRLIVQGFIYYRSMKKLNEGDLFAWWWLFDIWMFLYYIIFLPALWKKPRPTWN